MSSEEKPYEFKTNASVNELKTFQGSHIWRDICDYIEFKLSGNMEILKVSAEHPTVLRCQGAISVAEDILTLPEQMIEWVEEDQELNQKEDNG